MNPYADVVTGLAVLLFVLFIFWLYRKMDEAVNG